ncbi:MAG: Ribonuclease [Firmicutes bacterium]|nr:Ribonuclease [Bacillota bacterium]
MSRDRSGKASVTNPVTTPVTSPVTVPVTDILVYRDVAARVQAVLLEDGQAVEWIRPQRPGAAVRQDIILGRIEAIEPALNGAFVAIGQTENGLLPLKEAPANLKVGQSLVVQIRRLTTLTDDVTSSRSCDAGSDDPIDRGPASQPVNRSTKGHLLTTRIQYPGLFIVYEPIGDHQILRSKARPLDETMRTTLTAQELQVLKDQHSQVLAAATAPGTLPRLLLRPNETVPTALQSWSSLNLRSFQVSDLELFQEADRYLAARWPALLPKLRLHAGSFDLAAVFRLTDLAREASRRRILLKNGGSIVLDQTEALLAIDVNSGQARASEPARLRLQTNLLAATEIARQLRLRNIVGLVVVDFIRLADATARQELVAAFTAALAADRSKITIGGMTSLGLFELIRQAT